MSENGAKTMNEGGKEIVEWRMSKGFETNEDNLLEKLMLVVTEVSEAAEAYRIDDWINFNEEIADTIIRLLDITATFDINIDKEVAMKMAKNQGRPYRHGKRC